MCNLTPFILDTFKQILVPDEMQGLRISKIKKPIFMTELHHNLETSSCDPLKYKMDYSMPILYQHTWENP